MAKKEIIVRERQESVKDTKPLESSQIEKRIYTVRDIQVMIDLDLAFLYGVKNYALRQAVRRNMESFPEDFFIKTHSRQV